MLDRNSAQPLHVQLETILREYIVNEEWSVNTCIPSESALSREYGISRMTVRSVLNRMVDAGLIYRVTGKGTFVSEPKIVSKPLSQVGIRQQLEEMGYETTTKLIEIKRVQVPRRVEKMLGVERDTLVNVVHRMRYVKGEPLSIHTSYIPVSICNDLEKNDLEGMQMCDILEQVYHREIVRRVETLESVVAEPRDAQLLNVKNGFPLLLLENTVYSHGNLLIEFNSVLFRGDKIKINFTYDK